MQRYFDLYLPYFKQGDDLASCLKSAANDGEALRAHAGMLRSAAEILDRAATLADDNVIKIENADTHHIGVTCEEEVGLQLEEEGLLSHWDEEWEEDEDDDYSPYSDDDEDLMPEEPIDISDL